MATLGGLPAEMVTCFSSPSPMSPTTKDIVSLGNPQSTAEGTRIDVADTDTTIKNAAATLMREMGMFLWVEGWICTVTKESAV
eukprot:m.64905 g.64905  ORF g.64905 m.64905 type:complete len:83 (+) comp23495_c0_seq1:2326-2574(+)